MQSFLTQSFQISSGQTASGQFSIGAADRMVAVAPGLTSCQLFLEGAIQSGGPFVRMIKTDGTSSYIWAAAAGSAALAIDPLILPLPYGRLVASVAQAGNRVFNLVTRR